MPLLNYTTSIDYYKTIGEIQGILARKNVREISVKYENSLPVGLNFKMEMNGTFLEFSLPCNHIKLLKRLEKDARVPKKLKNEEQALRVSWRTVKSWVEAQIEMVETEMVSLQEVFLPYLLHPGKGVRLFELLQNDNKLLGI